MTDESRDPLGDLAEETSRRTDADEAVDDAFSRVEVVEVDGEQLWERLESDDAPAAEESRTISKRRYCQRCEHFADPPAVGCTRDGTEIVELVDGETFRVRNCPMVADAVTDD